jgi:hypothetical protein
MFDNDFEDTDLKRKAKEVARKTVQAEDWERYVEGAAFKILKLEKEVGKLKSYVYFMLFFVFILPVVGRLFV